MRVQSSIAILLLLAGFAWGQDSGESRVERSVWRAWTPSAPTIWNVASPPLAARRAPPARGVSLGELAVPVDPVAQELAYVFDVRPIWAHREDLEGTKEEGQRFERLPGGIVLGLHATARGLPEDARVMRDPARGLVLACADGPTFALPPVDPALLAACLEFVGAGDGSDTLIDCTSEATRIAPAFRGTPFERLLEHADRAPHRCLPRMACWKSLIVDRAVTLELRGEALALEAELELRFYGRGLDETDPSARVLTLALDDDAQPALAKELAPLTEIARWLGFLRWAQARDPQGFRALRTSAVFLPASSAE